VAALRLPDAFIHHEQQEEEEEVGCLSVSQRLCKLAVLLLGC
jgi:hypothetical protein